MPFVFLLLLSFLMLPFHSFGQQCFQAHHDSLLLLKNSFTTLEFTSCTLPSWAPDTDCCRWQGITCDASSGYVVSLDLSGCCFGPPVIFEALSMLTTLRSLDLSGNYFDSSLLPTTGFELLKDLTHLNLSASEFAGQVPIGIGRLEKLVSLDLSQNFDLQIPDLRTLVRNLTNLQVLYLDYNKINDIAWSAALAELPATKLRRLGLEGCNLSGTIPIFLSKFTLLKELRLYSNQLSSKVPEWLGNLSSLEYLDISLNSFVGPLPGSIFTTLTRLVFFDSSFNEGIYGPIPYFIGNCTSLMTLHLLECRLSGHIPITISNLTQLQYVDLSYNNFIGPLPTFESSNSTMVHLDLSYNHFSGSIPTTYNAFPELNHIDISENVLTGELPTFESSRKTIQHIALNDNQFIGSIPLTYGESQNYLSVHIAGNSLDGPLPVSLFASPSLITTIDISRNNFTWILDSTTSPLNITMLDFSYNKLTLVDSNQTRCPFPKIMKQLKLSYCNITTFPNFLRDCQFQLELDLSGNHITGLIPDWLWDVVNGAHLNISNNLLTGFEMPLHRELPFRLRSLDLHNNKLDAPFPLLCVDSLINYSNNNFTSSIPLNISSYHNIYFFRYLILSTDNLFGSLPSSICSLTSLLVLDVSNNNLSGRIPSCISQMHGLQLLNVRGNKFSGIIPPTMFSVRCSLQTLDLSTNMFEGAFPSHLSNCSYLEVLNIQNNLFIGTFPQMSNLTMLRVLILQGNKFKGRLESLDIRSNALQVLDLSFNDFSGTLQTNNFLGMTAMMQDTSDNKGGKLKYLNIGYYQQSFVFSWKGGKVYFERILTQFTVINLSNNKFQGKIPDVIGNLTSLYLLDLSHNKLSGSIPTSFGRLGDLESLDLSWNNLSGEIPMQLDSLDGLGYLNLSQNSLSGRIPSKGHLRTLPNSSYIGNDNLCGAPLTKECHTSPPRFQINDSKNNNYEVWLECNMLYICFAFGFCSGLAFVVATMLICNDGRRSIFIHVDKVLYKVLPLGFWH